MDDKASVMKPDISITSSLYKTEEHLVTWSKSLYQFAEEAKEIGLQFEINAIANDPSSEELYTLEKLSVYSWFNLCIVPREPIYASWNRGSRNGKAEMFTSWNVDDVRNAKAIKAGLDQLKDVNTETKKGNIVYFPFKYKRYVNFLNYNFLVKQTIVTPPSFTQKEFMQSMYLGPFFLFSKTAYTTTGPFDETYNIVGDFDWQIRAAQNNVSFFKSDTVAGIFTNNGKTLSGSRSEKHKAELKNVLDKYGISK